MWLCWIFFTSLSLENGNLQLIYLLKWWVFHSLCWFTRGQTNIPRAPRTSIDAFPLKLPHLRSARILLLEQPEFLLEFVGNPARVMRNRFLMKRTGADFQWEIMEMSILFSWFPWEPTLEKPIVIPMISPSVILPPFFLEKITIVCELNHV